MQKPKTISISRGLILAAICAGLVLSAFFGFKALRGMIRIHTTSLEPGISDADAIRGWMTVPYIAQVFKIAPEEIYLALGVPSSGSDKKSLQALNKEYFSGQRGIMLQKIQEAVRLKRGDGIERKPGKP